MVGARVLHPFAARARSAALVDAALTLLTHSAKNDWRSFLNASDLLEVRSLPKYKNTQ